MDYKEFIAKLGVEFASGDTDGHSRRIIDESYDTIMPDFKNKVKSSKDHLLLFHCYYRRKPILPIEI